MKSVHSLAACAALGLCIVATATPSHAQSNDEILRRLEAKIDALSKENASLRSRVNRIEGGRATAPAGSTRNASAPASPALSDAARNAQAADMPVKAMPQRVGCANFGGWYVGGNLGWAYYDHKYSDRNGLRISVDPGLPDSVSSDKDGFNGGLQGGYNWQSGCTIFGVEADWSWSDLTISKLNSDGNGGSQDTLNVESKMRWFGTARVRSGVIVDNLLLYVTGGLAYANFDRSFTFFQDGPPATGVFSSDKTKIGWTAGVGTEWAWTPNWSVKSEFLYMRFKEDGLTVAGNGTFGAAGQSYRLDSQDSMWVTRAGLNYRF
jgi:outer membrane immunogenic protein